MRFQLLLAIMASAAFAANAYAGAWTQKQGKGQVIVNGLYYATSTLYNNDGDKRSQTRYSKYELNPYFEYGWTDAITVGANLSLQNANQGVNNNWGIGDSEFFIRTRLFQQDGFVFSLEPMVKLASPENRDEVPALGGRHADIGLGASLGYGFSTGELNHFVNLDAGYRHRFGAPLDQVKLAGTLGVSLSDSWMVMPQAFATLRTDSPQVAAFTQSSGDDYDLLKLQLSVVYKLREDVSLQAGAFSHVDGRNVGAGEGVLFSVWKTF